MMSNTIKQMRRKGIGESMRNNEFDPPLEKSAFVEDFFLTAKLHGNQLKIYDPSLLPRRHTE
jgi:hypothetical protein